MVACLPKTEVITVLLITAQNCFTSSVIVNRSVYYKTELHILKTVALFFLCLAGEIPEHSVIVI